MSPRKANIATNGKYKATTLFDVKQLGAALTRGYISMGRQDGYTKKRSFSPSSLVYGNGRCARYWYIAFGGAHFEYSKDAKAIANMDNGTRSHERIQAALEHSGIVKELERELIVEDPPVHGFCDAVVEIDNEEIAGEIKTTKEVSFSIRKSTMLAPGYNLVQLLIYMFFFKIQKGFLMYENKNDHAVVILPVEMTERNRKIVEGIVDWMREVRRAFDESTLPERGFEEGSKECEECPVRRACADAGPGEILIGSLEIPK